MAVETPEIGAVETPEEWTCGHRSTGLTICAECQKILLQKLNELTAEVDRLMDLVQQHERKLSMSVAGA